MTPLLTGLRFCRSAMSVEDFADPEIVWLTQAEAEHFGETFDEDDHFFVWCPHRTGSTQEQLDLCRQNGVPVSDFQRFPRLGKVALAPLAKAGIEILCHYMAFDFDLPGHADWESPEQAHQYVARMVGDLDNWDVTEDSWQWVYSTKHGLRVVFALSEGVSPEDYENHYRWLLKFFEEGGWAFDRGVFDWTRLFRLPNVQRDGVQTGEAPYYLLVEGPGQPLEVSVLGKIESRFGRLDPDEVAAYADCVSEEPDRPDSYEVLRILNEGGKSPDWLTRFRRYCQSKQAYGFLFKGEKLAEDGERNNTLIRYVGSACDILNFLNDELSEEDQVDERRLYAIFYGAVSALEANPSKEHPLDQLWRFVTSVWPKEEAKRLARQVKKERAAELREQGLQGDLLVGASEWDPELPDEPEEAQEYLTGRLLAVCASSIFPIQANGRYSNHPANMTTLVAKIRNLGVGHLFPIHYYDDKQRRKTRRASELVDEHAFVLKGIKGKPQQSESGGYIDEDGFLVKDIYRRRDDLEPTFSPEVDEWLRALFGKNWSRAEQWLAWSLHFEGGPIAALSVCGPPGIGKDFLVQGLVEATTSRGKANPTDFFATHPASLADCGFLHVNEGWPRGGGAGTLNIADKFRDLVSGAPFKVNQKYQAEELILNPIRIVLTANNNKVVTALTGGQVMSKEDGEALNIRVMHLSADNRAAILLKRKGGADYTAGWVQGGGEVKNTFKLAKHLLWIHANRRDNAARGKRLLIEGDERGIFANYTRTGSGVAPVVIETLLDMTQSRCGLLSKGVKQPLAVDCFETPAGDVVPRVYVKVASVQRFFRTQGRREQMSSQDLHAIFESLSASTVYNGNRAGTAGTASWYRLDCRTLIDFAMRDGLDYSNLLKLCEQATLICLDKGELHPSTLRPVNK